MKKFTLTLFVTLLAGIQMVLAQEIRVTGTVSDESGAPMVGVTVVVEGTQRGTTTLGDGTYSLSAPANGTLQFSFIGMTPIVVPVNNRTVINVQMESDAELIDNVIVVAFGSSTKEAFTGSAGVLKADDIAKTQQTNVAQSLAGRVAGVQLSNTSGQPGANPSIRIRGFSSINAGNEPLWVVDGVPVEANFLNSLNPNDIESMTVLKDAASNALYGARGANGVIMVTTKRARSQEAIVTVDAKWGVNSRALKSYEYIKDPALYYETHYSALNKYYLANDFTADEAHARANQSLIGPASDGGLAYLVYTLPEGQDLIGANGKINPNATMGRKVTHNGQEYYLQADNWLNESYRHSVRQEYNVSVAGMRDRTSVYASFGYLSNKGIVDNSDYTRYTGRVKADFQAKEWLKIGGTASYANYDSNSLSNEGSSSSTGNIFAFTTAMAPIYPLYVRDGNRNIMTNNAGIPLYDHGDGMNAGLTRSLFPGSNAIASSRLNTNNSEGNIIGSNGFFEVKFLKDFTFKFDAGVTLREYRTTSVSNPYFGQFAGENGIVGKYHRRQLGQNITQTLHYNKTINSVHNINVTLAHDYYRTRFYYLYGTKSNMFSQNNQELSGAIIDKQGANSYTTDYNVEGYLGRAEYNYDNKYFFAGSFRRDASSKFHKDNRWGSFWALSGAWMITKENFMASTTSWLDMLKFKISYGQQGNDDIPAYRYTDTFYIQNSNDEIGLVFRSKGNKDITWETIGNLNTGIEFSIKGGLLSGGIEYFHRKTKDMLFSFPVAPSMGYSSYYANVGDMVNQGIELDLNVTPIQNRNIQWSINLNMAHIKNKITRLPEERRTLSVPDKNGKIHEGYVSGSTFYGQGLSIFTHYLKRYAGVNEEGKSMWYKNVTDAEGNTEIETTTTYSDASFYTCGSPVGDLFGGFGTNINFYGFDFSINFNYQIGGKAYDSGYASAMGGTDGGTTGRNWHKDILKAWTPENSNSNIPRLQYGDENVSAASDRFLLNASYLNLQNINFGYTLPKKITQKFGVGSLRVYLSWENVYYFSKRRGFDPRYINDSGNMVSTNQATYSPISTVSGGITLRF